MKITEKSIQEEILRMRDDNIPSDAVVDAVLALNRASGRKLSNGHLHTMIREALEPGYACLSETWIAANVPRDNHPARKLWDSLLERHRRLGYMFEQDRPSVCFHELLHSEHELRRLADALAKDGNEDY